MHTDQAIHKKVNLAGLKRFAVEKLPDGALRDDILAQPDEVTPEEYLENCRVWQRLARGLIRRLQHGPTITKVPLPRPTFP